MTVDKEKILMLKQYRSKVLEKKRTEKEETVGGLLLLDTGAKKQHRFIQQSVRNFCLNGAKEKRGTLHAYSTCVKNFASFS